MKLRIVYAVRAVGPSGNRPWLADTCAGGTWSSDELSAVTFTSAEAACEALEAAEIFDRGEYERFGHSALEIVALVERVTSSAREHEFIGDGLDCEACGEGCQYYLHTDRDPIQ